MQISIVQILNVSLSLGLVTAGFGDQCGVVEWSFEVSGSGRAEFRGRLWGFGLKVLSVAPLADTLMRLHWLFSNLEFV